MSLTIWMVRRRTCLTAWLILRTALCRSYVIQSHTWQFRNHPIAYQVVRRLENDNDDSGTPASLSAASRDDVAVATPLLLLNGFGVGNFHQHKLIHELMQQSQTDRAIYCVDYLGQGQSWPTNCADGRGSSEIGLRYCGETWLTQIVQFIEHIVLAKCGDRTKVHVVGNSVGGHLAVYLAAHRPDLVESVVLLNATPVWGLNLPGWNGHLPAPWLPRRLGRYLFDRIRDLNTIEKYLSNAYYNRNAFDDELMQQIRDCTDGPGGHAAFASILWSPPIAVLRPGTDTNITTFDDALYGATCDVLLCFGANDPWCKPAFARKMLQKLVTRPALSSSVASSTGTCQRYLEMSQVGHCPNHEAPVATARIVAAWMDAKSNRASLQLPSGPVDEAWGSTVITERTVEEIALSWTDRLAVAFV